MNVRPLKIIKSIGSVSKTGCLILRLSQAIAVIACTVIVTACVGDGEMGTPHGLKDQDGEVEVRTSDKHRVPGEDYPDKCSLPQAPINSSDRLREPAEHQRVEEEAKVNLSNWSSAQNNMDFAGEDSNICSLKGIFVVDRIVEGWVVLLAVEGSGAWCQWMEIPKDYMPEGIHEGSVLVDGQVSIEEEERIRARISQLLERLMGHTEQDRPSDDQAGSNLANDNKRDWYGHGDGGEQVINL